ncbi:outer membrane beta-barrel protein [Mucilaginibacter sp. RS28]|uniref:Outer membrane beta-barrel protein n=1 Tax=Mucilaginibacter straminoryzae TaxID=2932774 RepID=A0A9X2BAI9_9SPHI|nr:outer membrane beta-barrel protein [Mucilaginibacter straminoryzae]MCJ8210855.1 outer membrane beta-barrel protein [Mucilaginibacter straminoryzae]
MKRIPLLLVILFFGFSYASAQVAHEVRGTVIDSTKATLPGSVVTLVSDKKDSVNAAADVNGRFTFPNINGTKITLTIKSIGYQTLIKHYSIDANMRVADLGNILLKVANTTLNEVKIVGVNAVAVKEDTVEYKVSALNVRPNATLEDALKKAPGVDVDPTSGAVTAQGQQITKVRINGKDYMGGDVTSLTRNIPADLLESIQVVDDYGDQANLTGIKTGEPNKVLNVNIRKDRNYGYSLQATGGDGSDLLPKNTAPASGAGALTPQSNDNRYLGSLNYFSFKGDRQISVLGNLNNTNVNTFSFGSPSGGFGGGGAGGNFGGGGGGGRGNAARFGGGGSLTSSQNGITNAHSIGGNYRDQWGKHIAAYGSYSFADNSTFTNSVSQQLNTGQFPSSTNQTSTENDNNINHRFNFNIEYRPDTINYLKVTPTFTYAKTLTLSDDNVLNQQTSRTTGQLYTSTAYTSQTYANSSAPNLGLSAMYNHRFSTKGRNFNVLVNLSTGSNDQSQNPIYNYSAGTPLAPLNQLITTNSNNHAVSTSLSYLEPVGKVSFMELNYAYNNTYTSSDKETDTLNTFGTRTNYARLSNNFNYTFITHRAGLNYRVIEKKYNYTLGLGIQPAILDGNSITTGVQTHVTTVNFSPTARFVYNFARSNSLSINYNGNNNMPSFSQLQPVTDFSNALYPVQGNPNLKPEFANNFNIRYNKFSFQTGDVIFANASFTQTNDKISTNVITVPRSKALSNNAEYRDLQNTILTRYVNTDGYYSANGFFTYAKPWANRRYTLMFNGSATYSNNVGYVSSVDSVNAALTSQKNIAKNLILTPGMRFRVDLTDIVDVQFLSNYSINKTNNSVKNNLTQGGANVRTWTLGINGKNYFWKDWTLGYDFSHQINYGYTVAVTNPNILNAYAERRFLKNNAATIRASVFDAFNQNTGFSSNTTATSITQTNTNRLGRYFLLTFTLRLQKFAGRAPTQQPGERGFRRDGGGFGGPGGGPGGPGPGGPSLNE